MARIIGLLLIVFGIIAARGMSEYAIAHRTALGVGSLLIAIVPTIAGAVLALRAGHSARQDAPPSDVEDPIATRPSA
jgi:hypothetical protein